MYQDIIDGFIQTRDAKRQEERGSDAGEWHPSSLTGCLRQAVYSYTGEPVSDAKAVRNIRIMDRGTEMHEVIQAETIRHILSNGGAPSDYQVEVPVRYAGIHGSSDALLKVDEDESGPLYELQEYKSISPMGKKFMKGEPKPEHVMQARIYHACLRAMGWNLTDTIRIVYLDRDDWSVVEYIADAWLDVEFHDFLGTIATLEDHVEEGTLPDRMPDDYWLCRYCDYRTTCKG